MKKMKILIVENDVIVNRIWSSWLSRKQHQIRCAISAAEAISLIDEEMPDLLLLDLRLNGPSPKASGLRVFDYARRKNPDVPVIFITGLEYDVELYRKAKGFSDHDNSVGKYTTMVKKPISIDKLTDMVQSLEI
jgi:CheY-like chemotaxis protein